MMVKDGMTMWIEIFEKGSEDNETWIEYADSDYSKKTVAKRNRMSMRLDNAQRKEMTRNTMSMGFENGKAK